MGEVNWFFRGLSYLGSLLANLWHKNKPKKAKTTQKELESTRNANRIEKQVRYNERKAKLNDRRNNTNGRNR